MDPLDQGQALADRIAAVYGNADELASGSPADRALLAGIGAKYKALAPVMRHAAVVQSAPATGDDRHLEFYQPTERDNPRPGRSTFELFDNPTGQKREDAIAADALHRIGGTDGGRPVDPTWMGMKQELVGSRSPGQRRIDREAFQGEGEPGQTPDRWMQQNRADAYIRAGLFPQDNPEWQLPEGDPEGFTNDQRLLFGRMNDYLRTGKAQSKDQQYQDVVTALLGAR